MFLLLVFFGFITIVQPTPDNSPHAWCTSFATAVIRGDYVSSQGALLGSASSQRTGTISEVNGCVLITVPAPKSAGQFCSFADSRLAVGSGELKVTPWAPLFKYESMQIRPKTTVVKAGAVYKPDTNPGKFSSGSTAYYPIILESVGGPAKDIHFDFICK